MRRAAQNGLLAALLAQRGFAHVFAPEHDLDAVNCQWGQTWEFAKNTFKPYACGIVLHPVIDACLSLREQVRIDEVEKLELYVNKYVMELTGKRCIQTGLEGKFSQYDCSVIFRFCYTEKAV